MDSPTPPLREMEDAEVVREAARGEVEALAVLYDRHSGLMLAMANKILGDKTQAEDLTQDVFMEVWRRAHAFDASRGSVRTWLLVRLRSRALDRLRSARNRREVAVEEVSPSRPESTPEDPELQPDRAMVRQAIEQLPEEQRQVIELSYFHGLSSSEIATRMGSPLGTVKSRTAAALSKLRVAMTTVGVAGGGLQ
ncbi:MAG: sigma-70 family RNA polymerase sigma factor [Myxococcota bacterium]